MSRGPDRIRLQDLSEDLLEFATPRQAEVLKEVLANGWAAAARSLGMETRSVHKNVERLVDSAARQGYSPRHDMTNTVPNGYKIKGVSTYYDHDGEVRGQWVKSSEDHERQLAMMRECIEAMKEDIPKAKPLKAPKHGVDDLLCQYTITDYHLGMKAWEEETGANWDIHIAEDLIYNWFEKALALTPQAKTAVLCQLGDFTHFDSLRPETPEHRNLLDADTRAQLMARVAIRVYRRMVSSLLSKHEKVHIIVADANHDPMSAIWCREWLEAHYENEPRVTVDLGADGYYAYEHGLTSLFYHHGHRKRVTNVSDVFAAKFRELFGRTKYSYGHMGHFHHKDVKENNLMIVEQHPTLAASDAYASRSGMLARRDASAITYHKEYGEISRVTIVPEMAKAESTTGFSNASV